MFFPLSCHNRHIKNAAMATGAGAVGTVPRTAWRLQKTRSHSIRANQDFFLCFPIILKSEDLFPIAGRKSSQEEAGWAGWADMVWERPTWKCCCLHCFDTNIKRVLNNLEMLFCSLSDGCKTNKQTKRGIFRAGHLKYSQADLMSQTVLHCDSLMDTKR